MYNSLFLIFFSFSTINIIWNYIFHIFIHGNIYRLSSQNGLQVFSKNFRYIIDITMFFLENQFAIPFSSLLFNNISDLPYWIFMEKYNLRFLHRNFKPFVYFSHFWSRKPFALCIPISIIAFA